MIRYRCLTVLLVFAALIGPGSTVQAQSPERLVLAFYYTWFDENSWGANKVPDVPQQLYASRDRGVMGRHIDQAKGAGIDAFVVSWYGPRTENNQTETNLRAMLDEAAAHGFRIAVDFEVTSPFYGGTGDVQAALASLLATHAQHPAYLRSDGKPVIFFWRQQRFDVGTWAAIRNAVDPARGTVWIEEGVDVSPLSVFDGHHLYSVTWNPPTDMGSTAKKFAQRTRATAAKLGVPKVYVATVMPGYDDRKTGRGNAFSVGREDGAYYAALLAGSNQQCTGLDRNHQLQRVAGGHLYRAQPGLRNEVSGTNSPVVSRLSGLSAAARASRGRASGVPPR